MSTGAEPQAFIQGTQGPMEQDATQSTVLYFLQEASKLASPSHNSLLDLNLSPASSNKTSRQDAFIVKREAKEPHSFPASNCSPQHSPSHMWPYNQAKNSTEEKITTSDESGPRCNSPWEVMGLINMQCERLLHHKDLEEFYSSPVSSTTKSSHSSASTSGAAGQEFGCDGASPECTFGCSSVDREREANAACISPTEDTMGEWRAEGSEGSSGWVKGAQLASIVQPQTPEKIDPVRLELVEKNTMVYSPPAHRDTMEVKLSVITGLEWTEGDCFSTAYDTLNVSSPENTELQTHVTVASDDTAGPPNQQLGCDSDKDASVAVCHSSSAMEYLILEPAPALDFNSNLVLTASDTQLPPQSFLPPPLQSLLIEQNGKITASKPECRHVPMEEKSPSVPRPRSPSHMEETNLLGPLTSKPEPREGPAEGSSHPPPQQCSSTSTWRTKTPRKQPHPSRSADIQDPDFQGVMFRMHTELDASREQCRFVITSKYSKGLHKNVRKHRVKSRSSQSSLRTSSSEEESDPATSTAKSKACASCSTKKTPMWRDADGTPLCNACGIRYKKYRVRCVHCWHIPRKEGNSNSCCLKCGNFVGLTSAQRKHTT